MNVCFGLREEDAAEGSSMPEGNQVVRRAGGWRLDQLRLEQHMHATWHTAVKYQPGAASPFKTCILSNECTIVVRPPARMCDPCRRLLMRHAPFRSTLNRAQTTQLRPPTTAQLRAELLFLKRSRQAGWNRVAMEASKAIRREPAFAPRGPEETLKEFMGRNDVKGVLSTLDSFKHGTKGTTTQGHHPTTTAISMAKLILGNTALTSKQRQGKKIPPATMQLLRAVRLVGGEKVYNLLSANLNLPHERQIRKTIAQNAVNFQEGMCEDNFVTIGEIYKDIMTKQGISAGSVPSLMAEDETAIIAGVHWDAMYNVLVGLCGLLCKRKCTNVKDCRSEPPCPDTHACEPIRQMQMIVDADHTAFEKMQTFADNHRVSTHLRLVLVNPLHPDLPRLPCLMMGTCLTITCDEYIKPQWRQLDQWYDKHLLNIIGPQVGKSSDGDPRRRKAFITESAEPTDEVEADEERFTLDVDSFTFSSRIQANGHPMDDIHGRRLYPQLEEAHQRLGKPGTPVETGGACHQPDDARDC